MIDNDVMLAVIALFGGAFGLKLLEKMFRPTEIRLETQVSSEKELKDQLRHEVDRLSKEADKYATLSTQWMERFHTSELTNARLEARLQLLQVSYDTLLEDNKRLQAQMAALKLLVENKAIWHGNDTLG